MKVTKVQNVPVHTDGGGVSLFVRIETDAGIHGLGEVGTSKTGRAIMEAVDHLAEVVVGSDPWETERLWQLMFRGNFFPADRVYGCAISAIDIALWDIKGKSVDLPVYKLLGGPVREKVVSYPHTQGATTDDLVQNCLDRVEEGWKFVRWGQPETSGAFEQSGTSRLEPVESMRLAVDQMSKVREAVGPDIQISTGRTHPARHCTHRPDVQRSRRVQALLHRRPDTIRKPPAPTKTSEIRSVSPSPPASSGYPNGPSDRSSKKSSSTTPASISALSVASPKQQRSLTGQRLTTSTSCRTIR